MPGTGTEDLGGKSEHNFDLTNRVVTYTVFGDHGGKLKQRVVKKYAIKGIKEKASCYKLKIKNNGIDKMYFPKNSGSEIKYFLKNGYQWVFYNLTIPE